MRYATLARSFAFIVTYALVGCAAPGGTTFTGITPAQLHTQSTASGTRVLYVSDANTNAVYTFNPANIAAGPTGKITSGINRPGDLAVDPSGDLYVANGNNVIVYKPRASTPFKTITSKFGKPSEVAISPDNTIAITFGGGILSSGTLVVFDKGSATPTRTIPIPLLSQNSNTALFLPGLQIDSSDNIFLSVIHYAKGPDELLEFVPGSTHGIVTGLTPDIIGGFDTAHNIYTGGPAVGQVPGFICVYRPGGKTCARRITNGLTVVGFFAVTGNGTLFVPNGANGPANGNLVMFAPNASTPTVTFASSALTNPVGAAVGFIP